MKDILVFMQANPWLTLAMLLIMGVTLVKSLKAIRGTHSRRRSPLIKLVDKE